MPRKPGPNSLKAGPSTTVPRLGRSKACFPTILAPVRSCEIKAGGPLIQGKSRQIKVNKGSWKKICAHSGHERVAPSRTKSHQIALRTKIKPCPRFDPLSKRGTEGRALHALQDVFLSKPVKPGQPGQARSTFGLAEGRRQKTGDFFYGAMCATCRNRMPVKPRQTGSNQVNRCPRVAHSRDRGHATGASHPDANNCRCVRRLILFQFFICAGRLFW